MNKLIVKPTATTTTLVVLFTLVAASLIILSNPIYNTKLYRSYSIRKDKLERKIATQFLDLPMPVNYLHKDLLAAKTKQPAAWVLKQIKHDFANYNNASKQNVVATYQALQPENWVVMFNIVDGKVTVNKKTEMNEAAEHGLEIYTRLVEYLARQGYVHNVSFLLRLTDFFPNPAEFTAINAAPILTTAKDMNRKVEKDLILIPDYMNLEDMPKFFPRILHANKTFPWNKKQNKILWRGGHADLSGFRKAVVGYSEEHPGSIVDAKFSVDKKSSLEPEFQVSAKFLLTIDGHTAAWTRPAWQLLSNSVMLKQESSLTQWYYQAIQPDVHYISVNNDPNNLQPVITKYTDKELQTIAENGSRFAEQNLSIDDMAAYFTTVLKIYENFQQ